MQKARSFFFVCAGILCLMLAYHLGARSAGAPGLAVVVAVMSGWLSTVASTPVG